LMLSLLPEQLHIHILFLIIFGVVIRLFTRIILAHLHTGYPCGFGH